MSTEKKTILLLRNDNAANWEKNNPILRIGEPGFDNTNKILKIGDGKTTWNNLNGITSSGSSSSGTPSTVTPTSTFENAFDAAVAAGYEGTADNLLQFITDNKNNVISKTSGISWALLRELQGANQFFDIFSINDEIKDTYIDKSGTEYIQHWAVADNRNVFTEDNEEHNAVILQAVYTFPEEIQFDSPEPSNNDGHTDGYRRSYGNNNYSLSAARQYINSDKDIGEWWSSQHEWDVAPSQANTIPGLMKGFSEDFKSILTPVRVICQGNNAGENKQIYTMYDKLWLPSLEEIYCKPNEYSADMGIEGAYYQYWKKFWGNAELPVNYNNNSSYQVKNITDKSTSVHMWCRSCYSCSSHDVWGINSSGYVDGYDANYSCRVAPACAIFK